MEQLAYLQQMNVHQHQVNVHQQQLNEWVQAKLSAVEWDVSEIHHKFNMREAMEKYEEGIFHLLEFHDGWSTEESGISPPRRLADIAYLRQPQYATQRAKVNEYLTQFSTFTKYFPNLDALLGAMRQWSTAFKQPATEFSRDDHPQQEEMPEMFIRIGKQMTNLNLGILHADVMTVAFPGVSEVSLGDKPKVHGSSGET